MVEEHVIEPRPRRRRVIYIVAGFILAAVPFLFFVPSAFAAELYRSNDTVIRWDNTVKYSAAVRLQAPKRALITGPNADDGDRNFHTGFVSNRFDLLSELDIAVGSWGAAASAAAWYDTVYNDPPDADTATPRSLYPIPRRFSPAVRRLHGRNAELLNAFVYGTFDAGNTPISVRAGRHTLLWGESLFFAGNSIAAGQAPIDAIKALSVPLARAKEVFMPVAQVSVSIQPRPDIVVSAYYQFEWRKTRLPGAGSFFSAADFVDAGGYRLYVGRDQYLGRIADRHTPDSGQFGVSLRVNAGAFDYGFYALRFHAREPQLYLRPNAAPAASAAERRTGFERPAAYGTAPGVFAGPSNPLNILYPFGFGQGVGQVGSYNLVYPQGIEVYGASFSGYLGDSNVAGEISGRRRMPLVSSALVALPGVPADANRNPLYARGNSLHGQLSIITALAPGSLWRAASVSAEIAANRRLSLTRNVTALDPTRDKFAATFRALFEPSYFAVLPGLDLSIPIGFGIGLTGRSSTDPSQIADAGSVEFGLSATYRTVWRVSFAAAHFIGGAARQPFADRSFISFSLQRTF